ncbi:MAG TPA: TIGR03364 family FAD-dependent oxidoreductase [Ktedonobacterales bacterium]|nr:TIGR03364 family FAD-dependent oxidoreductase [Ktedonobacterales bacterium]
MTSASSTANRRADVIVIGAGVLGTFHAYFAAQKGYKTLLIERSPWPNDASTRNFGMVVQSIVETDSEWAGYARASREIYLALQQEHDLNVRRTGSLYLASTETERAVLAEFAQAFAPTYHCSYLPADEARQRYRFIQPDYCTGALLFPDDLTLEPRRLLRLLIPHLVEQGLIDYLPQTTIVAVEPGEQGARATDARGNVFTADKIFVCSGADYRTLFPAFFQASGLKVCKLQMMQTVPQPPETLPHSILSGLSIQRYPAFKSAPSYALLAEQSVDQRLRDYGVHLLFKQAIDGSIIIGDSHEYSSFDEATSSEERTNCLINEAVLEYGQRMITLPSWQIQNLWNGYYLLHPERQVYTEAITDSIHIVTGIAGKGMSTGPGFSQQHIATMLG